MVPEFLAFACHRRLLPVAWGFGCMSWRGCCRWVGGTCGRPGCVGRIAACGGAGARRDAGLGAGAGLPEQPVAQFAARRHARHRRRRAAGAVRLSAEVTVDRHRRRTILSTTTKNLARRCSARGDLFDAERLQRAVRRRRHRHADAVTTASRPPTGPARPRAQVLAARATLRVDRADRAAQRGDRLHEPPARQRDPRSAAAQRRGAAGAIAADPRPLQCRRGDAHRRGAVGIAAGRRPLAGAQRGSQLQGVGGDLSPGDRQSIRASSRPARRSTVSRRASLPARDRRRHRHPSGGDDGAIQCRRGAAAGEGRGGRALSDPVGAGQLQQNLWRRTSTPSRATTPRCSARSACRSIKAAREYSAIRQAKETLGQKRLDLDIARDQVRQNVVQSWGQLEAAKANIEATRRRCRPPRSRSTACARKRASASAPRSTCSMRSRNW